MKKITKNKKALIPIFNFFIALLLLAVLTIGYIDLSEKTKVEKVIGQNPIEVVTKIQQGENAMIFLDSAAKLSLYQAIYDMQDSGGLKGTSQCGDYYGFKKWNAPPDTSCILNSTAAKESLEQFFIQNLVARMSAYPSADFVGNLPATAFTTGTVHVYSSPAPQSQEDGESVEGSDEGSMQEPLKDVCPPGMFPFGQSKDVTSISPSQFSGDSIGNIILASAHCYEGRPYGNIEGGFVCTTFVEQVLKDLGVKVDSTMHKKINVILSEGLTETAAVKRDDPAIRGVAGALVDAGFAEMVASIDDAKPGDLVQYWYRKADGGWEGHAAIIENNKGNGRIDIYGAHAGKNSVTLWQGINIRPSENIKSFIARLKPEAVNLDPDQPFSCPTRSVICVPENTLPQTLYDFIVETSGKQTTLTGIARQNIAVGIDKTPPKIPLGAVCLPIEADQTYNIDFLKKEYGDSRLDVESRLDTVDFMNRTVRVHKNIVPALGCVEQEIMKCQEAREYSFRTIDSYKWQPLDENPDLLATSSFGISLNINLDTNLNSQDGELRTQIPECIVDAFKRFGFRWGGDFETAKIPSHFEFMADPDGIRVLTGLREVSSQRVTVADFECIIEVPGIDTQAIGTSKSGRLENGYAAQRDSDYIRQVAREPGRNYATTELAKALMISGCLLKNKYGVKLVYTDLSREGGGEFPPHQTHQAGMSADLRFISKTSSGYSTKSGMIAVPKSTTTCESQHVNPDFDPAANYDMIKTIVEAHPVSYICLDCNLENALKEYADKNYPGEWERLNLGKIIYHAPEHHHHFHITIACPEGDTRCGKALV